MKAQAAKKLARLLDGLTYEQLIHVISFCFSKIKWTPK